jgi:beta-lactamase regulating signal transducer with metallopeptidase domain
MMPFGLPRDSWHLLGDLVTPAVRALACAGATSVALVVLRVSRATVRLFAWTVVLYAALAMPLLCWVMPTLRWSLPNSVGAHHLPITSATAPGNVDQSPHNVPVSTLPPKTTARQGQATRLSGGSEPSSLVSVNFASHPLRQAIYRFTHWGAIVLTIYLAGLLLLLFRGALGWIVARRLKRTALPIEDTDASKRLRFSARAARSRRLPQLAEAEALAVPLTLSVLRPVILLPANWRQWNEEKLEAVLAHEMAHVARGDAFTQQLSLLHCAFFWFSPLAWWLHRHIGELAEQASDEVALGAGADQTRYAETLIDFFAEVYAATPATPRRVRWQALAMARGSGAERRVEHILAWKINTPIRLTKFAVVGTVLLATPLVLLAASLRPAITPSRTSTPPSIASALAAESVSSRSASTLRPAESPGETLLSDGFGSKTLAEIQAAPSKQPSVALCGVPTLVHCLPMDVKQLAWLSRYAGRPTFEVTSDSRFHSLVQAATPNAIFHLGYDMPLSQAIESMLNGPSFAAELRDGPPNGPNGRYLMISAQRSERGIGQSFYWFDLQQGLTFGGIFFSPTNGEPTPTLTIFSNQIGDRITEASQLPAAFLQDLEIWRASRNVPPAAVRYFINASGWKSVLMHDACNPANGSPAGDPSECQAMNEAAGESDMQASLYLLRIHYAEGSPARVQLEAAQSQWEASELGGCEGKPDRLGCRARLTSARARELSDIYSGSHL